MTLEAAARAAHTLDSLGDGILSIDNAGRVTYLNAVAEAMTGWARETAAGRPVEEVFVLVGRTTREPVDNPLRAALAGNRTVGLTPNCNLLRRDGHETPIEDSASPIHDERGTVEGAVIVFRDVGAALEQTRLLATLALHDGLTGLPNRVLLKDRIGEAIALRSRHKSSLAVCFVDMDGFKGVNDRLGHRAGDQLLCAVSRQLTNAIRRSDTVSRYGGDEFVVLLSELEHPRYASIVADKLLQSVAGPHLLDSEEISLTASIGVALYPEHGRDAVTLIANADAAMYEGKVNGPGQCRIFDDDTHARAIARLTKNKPANHVPSPARV